ncbi:MAG: hypothetical protein ACOC1Z_01935 [Cyanobacteriota bacterium]
MQTSTQLGKQLQNKTVELLLPPKEQPTSSVGSQPTAVILNSLQPWLKYTPYQLLPLPETSTSIWEKLKFWRKKKPQKIKVEIKPLSSPKKANWLTQVPFLPANSFRKKVKTEKSHLIRGIASDMTTGKLVLATTNNQTIDILSDQQHQQLKKRIKVIIECYEELQQPWWWRVVNSPKKQRLNPIQWLSQFLLWIQTSPLAKRLNLFQESQLKFPAGADTISQIPPPNQLDNLDRTLARWEKTKLSPVIKKIRNWKANLGKQDNNAILSLIRSAVDYFYGVTSQKRLTGEGESYSPKMLQPVYKFAQRRFNKSGLRRDPYSIARLIEAAFDYFRGKENQGLSDAEGEISLPENWLTKGDLFGEGETGKQLSPVISDEDFSAAIAQQLSTTLSKNHDQTQQQETASENSHYLQTEAIPVGYEKHILARILEWLDRALAWLEKWVIKLWQKLRK